MFRAPGSDTSFVSTSGHLTATEGASVQDQLVIMPATGANTKKATGIVPAALLGRVPAAEDRGARRRAPMVPGRQRQARRSAATVAPAAVLDHGHDWIGDNDLMRG
jgi:hypothetical protein